MNPFFRLLPALLLVTLLTWGAAAPVHAQKRSSQATINLPQTLVLKEFIKIISKATDTVFLYQEQNLRGQMSITAPQNLTISLEDAMFFFEQILASQGLTMVDHQGGKVVEILPAGDARFRKLPLSQDEDGFLSGEGYAMRLIRVKHADLKRIQGTIQPIFSKTGVMLVYEPLDLLIVIDEVANVNRVVELVDALDIPDPQGVAQLVTLYPVKHNDAAEIHKTVTELFTNLVRSGKPPQFKLFIEARLNSLFIVADQNTTNDLLALLEQVDVPVKGADRTIYELRFSEASQLVPLITQIFPKTASLQLVPFTPLNALIIIANPTTTEEVIALLKELDIPRGNRQIQLHRLQYASAKTLAPLLSSIFADKVVAGKGEGQTASGSPVKVIAEPRLNALIVIADRLDAERVLSLAKELDVSSTGSGEVQIRLHPLQYTSAQVIAPLLSKVFSDRVVAGKDEGQTASSSPIKIIEETRLNALIIIADRIEITRILNLVEQLDVFQDNGKVQSNFKLYPLKYAVASDLAGLLRELTGQITQVARQVTPESPQTPVTLEATASPAQDISITADTATNSLLIFAPADTFLTFDQLVSQLDVPRLQVYVEALIMEVSLTKSLNLGINWKAAGATDNNRIVTGGFPGGGAFTSATTGDTSAVASAGGATLGVLNGNTIAIGDQEFFSFGAFITATKTDQDVNVLANPQLLMLNNEEANINVSTNVPIGTKTVTDSNGAKTTQYEFKDIGIQLTIKPQISGEDSIRLEIKQESSNVSSQQFLSADQAITTFKRELNTSVVTGNDEIVVLGGLINERSNRVTSKIPAFGDLPLIGWLFRNNSDGVDKTNLLLFIRPTIVRDQQDLVRITERARNRYDQTNQTPNLSDQVRKDLGLQRITPQDLLDKMPANPDAGDAPSEEAPTTEETTPEAPTSEAPAAE